jgi:hypothetical protein
LFFLSPRSPQPARTVVDHRNLQKFSNRYDYSREIKSQLLFIEIHSTMLDFESGLDRNPKKLGF